LRSSGLYAEIYARQLRAPDAGVVPDRSGAASFSTDLTRGQPREGLR
jgi:hypothetical protein